MLKKEIFYLYRKGIAATACVYGVRINDYESRSLEIFKVVNA
tara:strand:+ start:1522 stop:1647 length:126 start_codon:yes stop_codon:yes gene_type:complete